MCSPSTMYQACRHWISDTLCRLATGGGFAVRRLYSDMDEVLFDAARPVILNGIEDIVTRPDLADRAVFLTLEPIPEEPPPRGGIMGRVRGRAPAHPRRAAGRGGGGPEASSRHASAEAAAHGRLRLVGYRLRDRALGGAHPVPARARRRRGRAMVIRCKLRRNRRRRVWPEGSASWPASRPAISTRR